MATVTATVRDPSGNIYANALVIASFVGQNTTPGAGPYLIGGLPQGVFELVVPGATDSNGNFSMTVTGNDTIQPTPSTWRWTVVGNTLPPVSFSALISVTGASIDISTALQAAAAPISPIIAFGNITATNLTVTGLSTLNNVTTSGTETSTGAVNLSGATITRLRAAAGLITTLNGEIGFDTTSNNWHVWDGTAGDQLIAVLSATPASGDVVVFNVTGGRVRIIDGGGAPALLNASNTYTGGTQNFGGIILLGDGSAAAPSLAFSAAPGTGWFRNGAAFLQMSGGGTAGPIIWTNIMRPGSGFTYQWSSATDPTSTAADTGISRISAGIVGIGNGTQGDVSGSLRTTTIQAYRWQSITTADFAASTSGVLQIQTGFASPNAVRLYWGDGSGWNLNLSKRVASVDTDIFTFKDTGAFVFGGDTGISRSAAATVAVGNGTAGDASGTLKAANIFANGAVSGATTGDIGASRTANTGAYYLGTDGVIALFRSAVNAISIHSGAGELGFPLVADTVVARATTDTLTNKRVTPRNVAVADATSITPNSDTSDIVTQTNTQLAGTLTINAPTGTPTDGQKLIIRIKATNAQTYSFNGTYHFSTSVTAPTTLAAGKTDYIGCMWNATNTAWDVVAVDQGH